MMTARSAHWRMIALFALLAGAGAYAMSESLFSLWTISQESSTFTHVPMIPLISLWLIWRTRSTLALEPIRPSPWGAVAMAPMGLMWLAGSLAGVNAPQHFALAGMAVCLVVLLWGPKFAYKIAFPLAFLAFAVPFGEFLLPMMMDYTADFTIGAVRLSGIPVLRQW